MSSAGHVADALNRLIANQALKKRKRERHQRMMDAYATELPHREIDPELLENKLSVEEWRKFRAQLKKDRIRENLFSLLALIISIGILAVVAYFILR